MTTAQTQTLAPFLRWAGGIPDNWPGECVLRFESGRPGHCYIEYFGADEAEGGITIDEWRALAVAFKSTTTTVVTPPGE